MTFSLTSRIHWQMWDKCLSYKLVERFWKPLKTDVQIWSQVQLYIWNVISNLKMYWNVLKTRFIISSCLPFAARGNLFPYLPAKLSLWLFPTLMFQSEFTEIILIISLTFFSKLSSDEQLRIDWMGFSFLLYSWIQMFAHSFISKFDTQSW